MFEAVALGFLLTRELLLLAAIGIALMGIDDLFVDAVFLGRRAWRAATIRRRHPVIRAEAMGTANPAPMAILVPAWDEGAVIGPMLRGLLATFDYPAYRVFVGVYPNDPATLAAVRAVRDRRVEIVPVARPGPTTKADCLNHLWRAVLACEARRRMRFKAIVLHDAEDVVHPHELRVFDHLIPRIAMVQLPVLPFPDRTSRWIAGHYLDEFAESHVKDVCVREALGAGVPSAGVACAIDRGALERAAAGGQPFDPDCFTEDYELGLRLAQMGCRTALVRVRDAGGRLVATREHFPATLDAAVRQKSRWMLGIALAGWDRLGWSGGFADRYMLWRDRKPLLTAPLLLLSYLALACGVMCALVQAAWPAAAALPAIASPGSTLALLLQLNGALLVWRLLLRAVFTGDAHGWREGARAVPRALAANLVNVLATVRAARRYAAGRRQTLGWEKTAHRLPDPARVPA